VVERHSGSERIEDAIDLHSLMSGDTFQNYGHQSLFYFTMQRDRDSLKPGIERLKSNMSPDLLDEMVIPMPAEACDQIIAGYFRWRSQAANTNCETT
jgi:hypothetical protein